MNIAQYKEAIKICRAANRPLMAWGPGGVGKTRGAEQAAEEENISCIVIQGPLLTPVDLLGLPEREGNSTIWLRPAILPTEGEGIIIVDELPDSTPAMMKAYYQLILDGKVQTHVLPPGWWRMGCGNRPEDGGMSNPIPAPLITRFIHIGVCCECPDFSEETPAEAIIDHKDFLAYAIPKFHPLVGAYLQIRPQNHYSHQAVPRTWEYVSDLLYISTDHFSFVFKELICGTVGKIVGIDFNNFVRLATKIPSIDAIIADPENYRIPQEKDILYALVVALVKMMNDSNITSILKYLLRIDKEYQFFAFNSAERIYDPIIGEPEYIVWKNQNKEYLI